MIWQDIAKFGKKLVANRLVESHFGNISVRMGSKLKYYFELARKW